jgi:homoserine O-acetyltransferase
MNERFAAPFAGDANNYLYLFEASRDYNPLDQIDKIKATVLAINSADDERNPPELQVMEKALARISNARLLLIPASDQTAGHNTTGQAKWWKQEVGALIESAPYLK